jgi:hypothetical protein
LRSSSAAVGATEASGAPQNGQNGNSPGSFFLQAGQAATGRVYDDGFRVSLTVGK